MNKGYIKILCFIIFALIASAWLLQVESLPDNIIGALLLVVPGGIILLIKQNFNQTGNSKFNIATPIMNKYSITKQKSISIIIGAKNSGKSSILKNNNYSPIPENKLHGPSIGKWWQLENDIFFEVDIDKDFNPEFITDDEQCWQTLLNKIQKQLLPYNHIKSIVIVLPIQILHQSNAPLKSYLSKTKKLLNALHSNASKAGLNIVFSHCDAICGFQSFFYGLENTEKSQLLTVNKERHEHKLPLANIFTAKFTKIIEALQQQMFARLRQEHDLAKKIEIKDFPLQLEALTKTIKELLMTIEIVCPGQTQGIYFCSNATNNQIYDFIQSSSPISTTKQQIVLLNNKEQHHCYFNANIISNILSHSHTRTFNTKDSILAGSLIIISIGSIILFKISFESYKLTNNITNQVESMIAVKANNNNSEIDRLYLALKYLTHSQNSNEQTKELRTHLKSHYTKQLSSTLSKEINHKINQYFNNKIINNESLFLQYINTKLIFINEPDSKKRDWLKQLLNNNSHHKYLDEHIENLFASKSYSIDFPKDIQIKINSKLQSFSTSDKVMMLINKPQNKGKVHIGFPDESILNAKHFKNTIASQIPTACSKLVLSKEIPDSNKQQCITDSIKHYLLEYLNLWHYQNNSWQIQNYDSIAQLNSDIANVLSSNNDSNIANIKIVVDYLSSYKDPKLTNDINRYNSLIKNVDAWSKLLNDNELRSSLNHIIKLKPDYEKYYTATLEYHNKSDMSQIRKLENIAKSQPQEQRNWLNHIASDTLKLYEQKAYAYLDNIWQQTVYNMYQKKIANKFPVDSKSTDEMSISDFEQFFSADGVLQTYLSLVEPLINSKIINNTNRKAFFLARKIANSWFINDKLAIKLTMIPIDLTTNAGNFSLEIGNNKLAFDKNNLKSTTINWPEKGDDLITMEFTNKSGQSTIINKNSQWALLKLLQESEIKPLLTKNQFYVTFKKDAFAAQYQVISDDWFNLTELNYLELFNITEHI